MEFRLALFFAALAAATTVAAVPNPDSNCQPACIPGKLPPFCPEGKFVGGSPGCWNCCGPGPTPIPIPKACLDACFPEIPKCGKGEVVGGGEGCWTCCIV